MAVDEIGGTPHQAASLWLEANGVSAINDVHFLPYADGNLALEALERGQVEAVSLWDPLGSLAAVDGRADVLMEEEALKLAAERSRKLEAEAAAKAAPEGEGTSGDEAKDSQTASPEA